MFGYNNGYYPPPIADNLQMYRNQQYQQPMQPQMQQIQQAPNNQPNNERIWVQGLEGAKAYMMIPGAEAVLWDSEKPYIYIKTADLQGRPNLQILSYSKSDQGGNAENQPCLTDFVTRKEFEEFKNQLESKPTEKGENEK